MNDTLRVLIVDDETPARTRLRDLLGDIGATCPNVVVGMAANGVEALRLIEQAGGADVVLCDIRMPVMDGVELARHLGRMTEPPAVIFTTAYDQYAVQAFELAAVDYLLKPVRAERLAAALAKVRQRRVPTDQALAALAPGERRHFSVNERGRILLLPVVDVRYLKAELKYVTARTIEREFVLDEALTQIEHEFGERFLRIHRNCLVARAAVAGVERAGEQDGEAHWEILLTGVPERLPVSRRQWPAVKQALGL
ncbi:LytR/AlgR family response regulator transcription factor [Azoarcus olearius]|uniref:Probable alginate biosynthesis regulatory protein AlgR n=1 Tax=Azoarcus sp. (strain BH72) TaxID=418699 RepID=A1K453_AZOSB|nr:LytTR family DNA-binding domain-containing protein [Azoarcus olearius]ANQ84156.1 alginate biosynthesis regulatory protein AlgR [Azoarcus olearius]CAL93608.1 probable alginate biosynthesis regulatory protein AlgR [Azoarcus olearius]